MYEREIPKEFSKLVDDHWFRVVRRHRRAYPTAPFRGVENVSTATAAKALTKKELKSFRDLLEEKRRLMLERARKTLSEDMTLDTNDLPDEMDLASSEYIQSFEFRLRGREKSLLAKLDLAIRKIDDGTFGICEVCEEPIGKKRLEARPETSLCIKCKEDQEREEKTMG
jgi:DnaK suppressor protein